MKAVIHKTPVAIVVVLLMAVSLLALKLIPSRHVPKTDNSEQRPGTVAEPANPPEAPAIPKGLSAYQNLWKLEQDLPRSLDEILKLAVREDGVGYWARLAAARAHSALSDHAGAAAMYRSALDLRALAEPVMRQPVRQQYAIALEKAGDREGAFREWSNLLPEPKALSEARRLAPDAASLAAALVRVRLFDEAVKSVENHTTSTAVYWRSRAYTGLGRHDLAALDLATYLRDNPGDVPARLEYANALERSGKLDQALREFSALGDDGKLGQGRVLSAMGKKREAVQAFLSSPSPEAKRRAGILLVELGEHMRALTVFKDLAALGHSVSQEAALRGLSIADRTRDQAAKQVLESLLRPGPAWLRGMHAKLNVVEDEPCGEPLAIATARELLEALGEDRGQELAKIEVEIAVAKAPDAEKLVLGEWLSAAGEYRMGLRIAFDVMRRHPSRRAYALAYPKAFYSEVSEASKRHNVDPFLILAVMREESHFDRQALSVVGARGLMQIMPATARSIAPQIGVAFSEASLFDPAINIQMGAWYIKSMLDRFGGDVPRAAAAYNAGPGSVDRWISTPLGKTRAYFVEAITFAETRGYVIKVLDSWLIYHWLYSEGGEMPSHGRAR